MPDNNIPPPPDGSGISEGDLNVDSNTLGTGTPVDKLPPPPDDSGVIYGNRQKFNVAQKIFQSADALREQERFVPNPEERFQLNINEDEERWLWEKRNTLSPEQLEEATQIFGGRHSEQGGFLQPNSFYFDPNTGLPQPIKYGQKIPENAQISSIWGFAANEDESVFKTAAKSVFNSVIDVAQVPFNLMEMGSGLVTDDETWVSDLARNFRNVGESLDFQLSEDAQQPLVNEKAFESVSEFFNSENWDPSLDNTTALTGSVIGSVLQFAGGAGWFKGASTAGKVASNGAKVKQLLGMAGLSSLISTNEALAEVEDVDDLSVREKMAFATMNSIAIGSLEVLMGGPEMRLLTGMKTAGVREAVRKSLLKEVRKSAGSLTGESLSKAYRGAINEGLSAMGRIAERSIATSLKEGSEELFQTAWQKGSEQLFDRIKGFQDGEGFGTDITSPESLQELFMSAVSGSLGGRFLGLVTPSNSRAKNNVVYNEIRKGKKLELINELDNMLDKGKISQEERDETTSRINAFSQFFENTQDFDLNEGDRKELFMNLYESEQLGIEIDRIEKDDTLTDELKSVKSQDVRDRKKQFDKKVDQIRKGTKPEQVTPDLTEEQEAQLDLLVAQPTQKPTTPRTAREFLNSLAVGDQVIVSDAEGNLLDPNNPNPIITQINPDDTVNLEGFEESVPFENIFPNTKGNLRATVNPDRVPSQGLTDEDVFADGRLTDSERDTLLNLGFTTTEVDTMTGDQGRDIIERSLSELAGEEPIDPETEIARIQEASRPLEEVSEPDLIEVAKRFDDAGAFTGEQRADLGMRTPEINQGLQDIREGVNTDAARKILDFVQSSLETGDFPVVSGTGTQVTRDVLPTSEVGIELPEGVEIRQFRPEEQVVEPLSAEESVAFIGDAIGQISTGVNPKNIEVGGLGPGDVLLSLKDQIPTEQYEQLRNALNEAIVTRKSIADGNLDAVLEQVSTGQEAEISDELADEYNIDEDIIQQKAIREQLAGEVNTSRDIEKVIKRLQLAFPNIDVYSNKEIFDRTLEEAGFKGGEADKPLGFIYQGTVYIDPTRATVETPIHEFGHIWTLSTKENNRALYDEGIELVRGTKYEQFAKSLYPELGEEQQMEEALATAIGEKGANAFSEAVPNESFVERFKKFVNDVFAGVRRLFGFEGTRGLEDAALSQFANSVVNSMVSESPVDTLSTEQLAILQGVNELHAQRVSAQELSDVAALSPTKTDQIIDSLAGVLKNLKKTLDKAVVPISTRITKKSERIGRLVKNFEFNLSQQMSKDTKVVTDYLNARAKSDMTRQDKDQVDYLLSKNEREAARDILASFGITKEFDDLLGMLDQIKNRSIESGVDLDVVDDYFPRVVRDFDNLVEFLSSEEEAFSPILDAIEAKDEEYLQHFNRRMTNEEKAALMDRLMRGFKSAGISLARTGNERARTIDLTPELFQKFYHKAEDSLPIYISRMNNAVESRKLFRPDQFEGSTESIEESLGALMLEEIEAGRLTDSEAKEIQDVLIARFNQGTPNKIIREFKNVSYIAVMGNPGSAVTQIGDLAFSIYKNGLMTTLKNVSKAAIGKSNVTKADLGLDQISAEFLTRGKTSFWVNRVFKIVGLEKMDAIGKETFINSTIDRLKSQAQNPTDSFKSSLETVLEPEEVDQAIDDLKNDRVSELVKRLAFVELSGIQPLTPSEMPEAYLRGGNTKVFYMLKSFTIKQLDFYRREIFDNIAEGVKTNNKQLVVKGLQDLVYFSSVFMLMGLTSDEIKDLMFGRSNSFSDNVVDNVYKLAGFNRYTVYQAQRKGILDAGIDYIMPPTGFINDLGRDVFTLGDDKGFKSSKYVPLVGKGYYYWFGRGAE